MKRCLKIILAIFFLVLFSFQSNAESLGDYESEYSELYDVIENDLSSFGISDLDSAIRFENVIGLFFKSIAGAFIKYNSEYTNILITATVVFIYESICKSFSGKVFEVTNIAVLLIFGFNLFDLINKIIMSFVESQAQVSGYISSVSAVSLTALISSAMGTSAASLGTACTALISVYNYVCTNVILPYTSIYLSMSLCGSITSDFNLRRASSFTRNVSIGFVGGILALFCGIMSVQSVISMSKDTLFKKTIKQMFSSGLPVLGSAVSEGIDTLFTSALEIKNQAGLLGITVTVLMSVAPLTEILVCFAVLSVVGFIFSFFEGFVLSDFINTVRDLISVLICISFSLTIMVILLFYFIIKVT